MTIKQATQEARDKHVIAIFKKSMEDLVAKKGGADPVEQCLIDAIDKPLNPHELRRLAEQILRIATHEQTKVDFINSMSSYVGSHVCDTDDIARRFLWDAAANYAWMPAETWTEPGD